MRNADFVMPAWIAGIQVREDASGNIHVSLDSSAPCWNDSIKEGRTWRDRSRSARYFRRSTWSARRFWSKKSPKPSCPSRLSWWECFSKFAATSI